MLLNENDQFSQIMRSREANLLLQENRFDCFLSGLLRMKNGLVWQDTTV